MAAVLWPAWRSGGLPYLFTTRSSVLPAVWLPSTDRLPIFQSLLELLSPFLLAVPKKKTSHSRKAMRSANKGLKDKTNIVNCPGCGGAKLAHHLCPECYSSTNRAWKAQQKQSQEGGTIQNVEV